MTWLSDYEAKLDGLVAQRINQTNNPAQLAIQYLTGMHSLYAGEKPYKRPTNSGGGKGTSLGGILKGAGSGVLYALDKVERPLYGFEGLVNQAEKDKPLGEGSKALPFSGLNVFGEILTHPKKAASAFGKGFTTPQNAEHTTGGSIFRTAYGDHGPVDDIAGFGADVVLDPLTYVGAGPVIRGVKALGKGAKAAEVAGDASRVIAPDAVKSPQGLLDAIKAQDAIPPAESLPYKVVPDISPAGSKRQGLGEFSVSGAGESTHIPSQAPLGLPGPPSNVIGGRALLKTYDDLIGKIPSRKLAPGTVIKPNYNEITDAIPDEALTPVAVKKAAVKAAKVSGGLEPQTARTVAMLQHLLTHPETSRIQVTIGGRESTTTVKHLQSIAKSQPEKAKMIGQMIKNKAAELASMSEHDLAEAFPEGLKVRYSNLKGEGFPGGAGVDVNALQKLLETGRLPASAPHTVSEALDSATAQYALHSKEDLDALALRQMSGDPVSVRQYLDQLGVKASGVQPNVKSLLEGLTKGTPKTKDEPFKFDFEAETPAPVIPQPTVTKRVGLTKEQRTQWVADHPFLSPEQQKHLLSATSVTNFNKRVQEVLQTPGGAIGSMEDLVKAVEDGRVSEADLKDLLSATGGKTIKGASQKYNRTVANLAKAEHTMLNPEGNARADIAARLAEVKPAEQIVSEVAETGSAPELVGIKDALDPSQFELLKHALTFGTVANFIDPKDLEKYGFVTAKGVKRTANTLNKGYGRKLNSFNKYAQLNAFRSLVSPAVNKHVMAAIQRAGIKRSTASTVAAIKYEYIMPIMRAQEKILRAEGIPPVLGDGETGPLLSVVDVIDSLPKDFVQSTLFNGTKSAQSIIFTQYSDIAETIIQHGLGQIDEATMRQGIADAIRAPLSSRSLDSKGIKIYSGLAKSIFSKTKSNPQAAEDLLNKVVNQFVDAAPDIMTKYHANVAQAAIKFGTDIPKISNEVIDQVAKMFLDPYYSPGDLVEISDKLDNLTASVAKNFGINSPWEVNLAKQNVAARAGTILGPGMQAEAKAAKKYAAVGVKDYPKVGAQQASSDLHATQEILHDIQDIGEIQQGSIRYRILHGMAPHLGNPELRPLLLQDVPSQSFIATRTANALNNIKKSFAEEDIMAAWHEMQLGTVPGNPAVKAVYDAFKPIVDGVFDGNDAANPFLRNGLDFSHVNAKLRRYGLHEKYGMEDFDSWRQFDTDDPIDLVSKYHAAVRSAITDRSIGNHVTALFGSSVQHPGYVKVTGRNSKLLHFIDTDKFYPRDIAEQFSTLDLAMKEMDKAPTASKALKFYDGLMHMIKSGFTIFRPGHHVRNMVGDVWFGWMDGVNTMGPYIKALKAQSAMKGRYEDWDAIKALASREIEPGGPNEKIVHAMLGGKKIGMSAQEIYQSAVHAGIITDYHVIEDISDTGLHQMLTKVSPFRGKIHSAAVNVSEWREHNVRLAHYIHLLEKEGYPDLATAERLAGQRVRKWHPDGSDLGTSEKAVARRVFLFYSWMRKAIPLVVESAAMHPGKVLAYPKAYYAIAQSMGVDLNGFGDPYPTDQLFPSWIANQLDGPILGSAGGYFGISPGIPANDIANQFATTPANAGRSILGSVNPLIRTPFEVATGRQVGTGADIMDKSDYVDNNIPGVNTIAALSNHSVSGLGQPSRSVQIGNENGGPDEVALFNWLTGLSLMNQSRPSYIRGAQYEQRGHS